MSAKSLPKFNTEKSKKKIAKTSKPTSKKSTNTKKQPQSKTQKTALPKTKKLTLAKKPAVKKAALPKTKAGLAKKAVPKTRAALAKKAVPKTKAGLAKKAVPKTKTALAKKAMPKTRAANPARKTFVAKAQKTISAKSAKAKKPGLSKAQSKTRKPKITAPEASETTQPQVLETMPQPIDTKPVQPQVMFPQPQAVMSMPSQAMSMPQSSMPQAPQAILPQSQPIAATPVTSSGTPAEFEPINPEAIMYYQELTPREPRKSPFSNTQLSKYVQEPYVKEYIQQHSKAKQYLGQRPVIPRAKKVACWNDDIPYILSRKASQALPSFTFVGRERMFRAIEAQRANARHTALIGLRKMGKTTFVKRYYDYLFTTSTDVVPFFYSFMNLDERRGSKKSVIQVAEEMMVVFLSQALGFLIQDKALANNADLTELLDALDELAPEYKERYYEHFHKLIQQWYAKGILYPLYRMIQRSLDLTLAIKRRFDLAPVIMLDEYQEVGRSFVDENGESYDCIPILNKYHCNEDIFLLLSGSGLTTRMEEALPPAFEYRIERIPFGPLAKKDSLELMSRLIQALDLKTFEGIEEELYRLVDGNPYFIYSVLSFNRSYHHNFDEKATEKEQQVFKEKPEEEKNFTDVEWLLRAYNFECTNEQGRIYDFWHWYLVRNWRAYPTFLAFGQSVYKILKFLVDSNKTMPLQAIQEMMKKEPREEDDSWKGKEKQLIIRILLHLARIDLIVWDHDTDMIFITPEPTIVASIHAIKYGLFYPDDPEKIHQEENMYRHVVEIYKARKGLQELKDQVEDLQAGLKKVQQAGTGKLSHEKGKDAEAEVRRMIQNREGIFAPYPIQGNVRNEKIQDPSSKLEYELDCVAELDPAQFPIKDAPVAKIAYGEAGNPSAMGQAGNPLVMGQAGNPLASADNRLPTTMSKSTAGQTLATPEIVAGGNRTAGSETSSLEKTLPLLKPKGMLVVEVKDRNEKTNLAQAMHFIQSLQALQRVYGLTHVYAVFHSCAGFYKNAQKELMKHNIFVAECEQK